MNRPPPPPPTANGATRTRAVAGGRQALIVALLGGLLSLVTFVVVWRAETHRDEAVFRQRIANFLAGFQERRNGAEDVLRTLRAMFHQNPQLTRDQFRETIRDLAIRTEGVQALAWAPRVTAAQRAEFQAQQRQTGFPNFQITEGDIIHPATDQPVPAADRPEYFPVTFLDPYPGNEQVQGYDLGSVAETREAIEAGRDQGSIALSPLTYVHKDGAILPSVVAVIPVYWPEFAPEDEAARRTQFSGCVLAVFVLPEMMEWLVGRLPAGELDVLLLDLSAPASHRLLVAPFVSPAASASSDLETSFRRGPHLAQKTGIGGREWELLFRRGAAWRAGGQRWYAGGFLLVGLMFTGLLVRLLTTSAEHTRLVEASVRQRTAELAQANSRLQDEIRDRVRAQEDLAHERNLLRTLLDRLPDAVFIVDRNGRYVTLNKAHTRLLGLGLPDEGINRSVGQVGDPALARLLETGSAGVLASGTPRYNQEESFTRSDGTEVHLLTSWQAMRGARGEVDGWVVLVRDITKAKRAEDERQAFDHRLQETQKLESLGLLAGGIAHDFNNLLTGILGNVGLARLDTPPQSPVLDSLHDIERAATRAADLCRQMLAYAGKGRLVVSHVDLSNLVEQGLDLIRLSVSKKVELRTELAHGLPPVAADAAQIRQILMNLVSNAAEAIGDHPGLIRVVTGQRQMHRAELSRGTPPADLPDGAYVFLEVVDSGVGMAPDTLGRVFDPFFTTKFTGRGLGLAAVQGIARGHHGTIQVTSQPGQGSTFRLLLPAALRAADGGLSPTLSTADWRGQGTVLLVDDEEAVRRIAARILQKGGFEVCEACDGEDAVRQFSAAPDRFTAVLLDLTMPRLDGEEAFREIRRLRPGTRVLLMSGFSVQEATQRFAGQGLDSFLQKPFGPRELLLAMRSLLEPTPPAGNASSHT